MTDRRREVTTVTTQFEFHLKGVHAPEGQLEADQLIAIVQSLKSIALNVGRSETNADTIGRAPARVHRVATMVIGMSPGSTTIVAHRASAGDGALDLDLADEHAFDTRFEQVIAAVAADDRPDWVSEALAGSAGELAAALRRSAPEVEFKADQRVLRNVQTANLRRETWSTPVQPSAEEVSFTGRLFAVNLKSHRLLVQDDVGHQVALPRVSDDVEVGRLLNRRVVVSGIASRDSRGLLTQIIDSTIIAAPDPVGTAAVTDNISLEDILDSVSGPDPDDGIDLTEEEFDAFITAARG